MNLRFLRNYDEKDCTLIDDTRILEKEYHESKYGIFDNVRYYIYDTSSNERTEIMPKVYKLDMMKIVNAQFHSTKIYFVQYLASDDDLNVIAYDYEQNTASIIYSFKGRIDEFNEDERFSVFILNENFFIIQKEIVRTDLPNGYRGFFLFESFLYNIREKKSYQIIDENLINNGIMALMPLSENLSCMKLGYNMLEDKRYEFISKIDIAVESLNIVNVSQFISDLTLEKNGIIMEALDQAFYKQTIPRAMVEGNYIIYSKIELNTMKEFTTFYDYVSKDAYACVNKNFTSPEKYTKALLIAGKPYVRLNKSKKTDFYNIKSQNIDFSLHNDRQINAIVNDIFVLTETKKGAFGKIKEYICVYKYPTMTILHSEKGVYTGCLYNKNTDTMFIFTE